MANLLRSQKYVRNKLDGGDTFTIRLRNTADTADLAATAGAKFVIVSTGGSGADIYFTNSGGTQFSRRARALSALDASIYDAVAAGGETDLYVDLAGAENVSFFIWESPDFGAFIGASDNGSGSVANNAGSLQCKASSAVAVATAAVGMAVWAAPTATAFGAEYQWRQMGPFGKLVANQGHSTTGTKYIWAAGICDVTATGRFPVTGAAGDYQLTSVWIPGGDTYTAQAFYADASGVPTVPAAPNPVVKENSLPGTHKDSWFLGVAGSNSGIAGYFDACSYAPGDTVSAKVDSNNAAWRMELYRLGWGGWETFAARQMVGHITGTAVVQSAPSVDSTLGSTSCAWTTNATWTIPSDAPSGIYYALFRRTDDTSKVASGHFVVRPSSLTGKTVVVVPDVTYQAYNLWGARTDNGPRFSPGVWTGRSFYAAGTDTGTNDFSHRAYAVSFDRPYSCQSTQANTYLFDSDQPLLHFLEAQGVDLAYVSEIDLEKNTTLLNGAGRVIMLGHQEYWSTNIYDAYRNAVNAGVNMLSTSSNTALWRVRFAAGDTSKRTVICYKESSSVDVSPGFDGGTGRDPVSYTGTWRDTRGALANPDIRNERSLTGQQFVLSAPVAAKHTVPFAAKSYPVWRNSAAIQALAGGDTYTTLANTVGDEVDAPDGGPGQPTNIVNLSPTQLTGTTGANPQGTTYSGTITFVTGLTMYRAESGALIATTGSWRYWRTCTRWALSAIAATSDPTALSVDWQNALLALIHDLGATCETPRALRPGVDPTVTAPTVGAPAGPRDNIAQAYGLRVPSDKGRFLIFFGP